MNEPTPVYDENERAESPTLAESLESRAFRAEIERMRSEINDRLQAVYDGAMSHNDFPTALRALEDMATMNGLHR